jgi:hypothetical protein
MRSIGDVDVCFQAKVAPSDELACSSLSGVVWARAMEVPSSIELNKPDGIRDDVKGDIGPLSPKGEK